LKVQVSKIREKKKSKPQISTECEKKNLDFGIPFQKVATTGVGEEEDFDLSLSDPPWGASIFTDPNGPQNAKF
jgi:hypothetical protein